VPGIMERFGASWRAAIRDILLIVVSILIAFALDAWWDGQLERGREREHLRSLQVEFKLTRERLESSLERVNEAFDATTRIIGLFSPSPEPIDLESLSYLINESFNVALFAPQGGAVQAVIDSGELSLLRNPELKELLAQWPVVTNTLSDATAFQAANREQVVQRMVQSGFPLSRIAGSFEWLDLPQTDFAYEADAFLSDVGFENYMVSRALRLGFLRQQYELALGTAEAIIRQLDKDLEPR
jgi:hypothetical protein